MSELDGVLRGGEGRGAGIGGWQNLLCLCMFGDFTGNIDVLQQFIKSKPSRAESVGASASSRRVSLSCYDNGYVLSHTGDECLNSVK